MPTGTATADELAPTAPVNLAELAAESVEEAAKPQSKAADQKVYAVLAAEGRPVAADKPTDWTYTYQAGGSTHTGRIVESARVYVTPAELLARCGDAARVAAKSLRRRHGIPALTEDERDDMAAELCARLLETTHGAMPKRERLTRSYLVRRCEGIVLNDPERQATDAAADGGEPLDLLAAAEGEAIERNRSGRDGADPMLNPGKGGESDPLRAAAEAIELPENSKARRYAAYCVGGGKVRDDWSLAWETTPGYAATKIVPDGRRQLEAILTDEQKRATYIAAAVEAQAPDDLDHLHMAIRDLMNGGGAADDVSRARKALAERFAWRDRIEPGDRIGRNGRAVPNYRVWTDGDVSDATRQACADALGRTRNRAADPTDWDKARV